jgi:hypothetical protein
MHSRSLLSRVPVTPYNSCTLRCDASNCCQPSNSKISGKRSKMSASDIAAVREADAEARSSAKAGLRLVYSQSAVVVPFPPDATIQQQYGIVRNGRVRTPCQNGFPSLVLCVGRRRTCLRSLLRILGQLTCPSFRTHTQVQRYGCPHITLTLTIAHSTAGKA